jgi:hypothetical protein
MAPWLNYLHSLWREAASDPDEDGGQELEDAESGLLEVASDPARFNEWFHEHIAESSLVVSVPGSGRRVTLMHNMWQSERHILGINGLAGTAPLKGLEISATTNGLFADKLAAQSGEAKVPSLRQFLDTKSVKDLMENIVGDSDRTVASYARMPPILLWPPTLLALAFDGAPPPKAGDMLYGLIRAFKSRIEEGEFTAADIEEGWIDKLVWLYLVAKGLTKSIKLSEPPEDTANGEQYLAKMRSLSTFQMNTGDDDKEGSTEDSGEMAPKLRQKEKKGHKSEGRKTARSPSPEDDPDGDPTEESTPSRKNEQKGKKKKKKKERGRSRERSPSPSGSESSDSSNSSSSSSSSSNSDTDSTTSSDDSSTARKRHLKKKKRKMSRSPTNKDINRMVALAVNDIAFNTKSSAARERKKSSLFSNWTDDAIRLFKLLSARDWKISKTPRLCAFAKKLVADRKITSASTMIKKASIEWEGSILDSGLAGFLSGGFMADNIVEEPGGLTAFICCPLDYEERRSKDRREQAIKDMFGDGKLTENAIKEFSSTKLFVPSTKSETEDQLKIVIRFLDLLTGEQSIASVGYRLGLSLLQKKGRMFAKAVAEDKAFFVKYVYLLDCTFNHFCKELMVEGTGKHPISRAKDKNVHEFQTSMIKDELRSFLRLGSVPSLSLPSILVATKGGIWGGPGGGSKDQSPTKKDGEKQKKKAPEGGKPENEPDWWKVNPSVVKEWCLPVGKDFAAIFGGENIENRRGYPRFKHHKFSREANVCHLYQTRGKCARGGKCKLAHVPADKMDPKVREVLDSRYAEVLSPFR